MQLAENGNEPVPFPDCTTTHMGETTPMTKRDWVGLERSRLPFDDECPWEDKSPWVEAQELLALEAETGPKTP